MSSGDGAAAVQPDIAPLLAINTASAGELDGLYGIGPALAARIVAFREQNGPFRGPDDLARVEGVSGELAYVLAPHIDWSHPVQEETRGGGWPDPVSGSVLVVVCLLFMFGQVRDLLSASRSTGLDRLIGIWNAGGLIVFYACGMLAAVFLTLAQSSRSSVRAARCFRRGVYFLGGSAFGMVNVGLANAAHFTFLAPGGWNALIGSPSRLFGLSTGVWFLVGCCSAIIVAFNPRYARSRVLAAVVNASVLLMTPLIAVGAWIFRDELPLYLIFIAGLVGAGAIMFGLEVVRGTSFLQIWSTHLRITGDERSSNLWVRWINLRLPDPEQQKALLDALQQVHPPSRWRTLRGLVITGAGTWILAATASAVWEWLVQNWLDSGFGGP
jgi:competence ComEA-like helix-hairpin-helix protein